MVSIAESMDAWMHANIPSPRLVAVVTPDPDHGTC